MVQRRHLAALAILMAGLCPEALAQERSVAAFAADLRSADSETRLRALQELRERGAAAAPAVPAVIELLRRVGWRSETGEPDAAFAVLEAVGAPAAAALPLLVRFMVESEPQNMHVQLCIEHIARTMGLAVVPHATAATAQEAMRWWKLPDYYGLPQNMADVMATARTGFSRTMLSLGSSAVPALVRGLRDDDPFVQAEAAAWLGILGPVASTSLPSLREARRRTSSDWTRYEIDRAIQRVH